MRTAHGKSAEGLIKDLFFQCPTMGFHLRALARKVGISPPAAKKAGEQLIRSGFLKKKRTPPTVTYTARHEEPAFRAEKRLWNIAQIQKSGVLEALKKEATPDAIILFGSYARGEDWEQSDIDLAIINGNRCKIDFSSFEKKLQRNIQLHFPNKKTPTALLNNVVNGIPLAGRWDPL